MTPLLPNGAPRLALVIGATGGVGGEVAKALIADGWRVRCLSRDPETARRQASWIGPVEWVAGDAMKKAEVQAAAIGVSVIFHGANPPKYRNWRGLAIPMLENSITAARASEARLIFPGNIYNFGPDAWPLVSETSPQHPLTRKGAVRVEMEEMLRKAADQGLRSLVVRAGDFFGSHQPSSWMKDAMIKPGRTITSVMYPGEPSVGHAWAYLPDLARTIVRLAEIEQTLPNFEVFHFGGHWIEPGVEMAKAIARVAGVPDVKIRCAPWLLMQLASPFLAFPRELMEMRYLWRVPMRLDNRKLIALIGREPHTPLEDALRDVLTELGCCPPSWPTREISEQDRSSWR
jgi:nucleoside-diphosphate-sugar epimerase